MTSTNPRLVWLNGGLDKDLRRFQREFESALGLRPSEPKRDAATPPFSIWEDADHYFVEADVPGVAESDIDVTLHDGRLSIRWERRAGEGRTFLFNSRHFGPQEHTLNLPEGAATDAVDAVVTQGVLRLTISKAVEAKPRKIEVRQG